MISDMRKHFQSPLYKATVWVGIVALAGVFSIPTLIKEVNSEPWAIKVNSIEVSTKEFHWALAEKRDWLAMVRAQYGEQADLLLQAFGIKPDAMSLAMESVIKEGLINDIARQMNIFLHEHSVQDRLLDVSFIKYYLNSLIPSFILQKDGSINTSILRNFLLHKGMKPTEFEGAVKKAIERKFIMDIFSLGSYAPLFDKSALYALDKAKRSFEILSLSYEKQLKEEKSKSLSDEEIDAYYAIKKGSMQYRIPEKRAGIALKFKAQDYGIEINRSEIESYYETHKAQLYALSPKKIEVRRILFKEDSQGAEQSAQGLYRLLIENPKQFSEQAKQVSEDKETAVRGGLMNPFARGEKDVAFEKAAFLLKNDGDISPVVKTAEGFEIVQRVAVIQPVYQSLSQVYDAIQASLLQSKFSSQFATDCKNLRLKFKKNKNEIDSFIQEKNGAEVALSLSPLEDSLLSKTLFGIKSVEGFDFCIEKDVAYIVQLSLLEKAYQADLSEVKDAVTEDIYKNRTEESLKRKAQEALNASGNVANLEGLKKHYNGSLISLRQVLTEDISKNDLIKDLHLQESSFALLDNVGLARLVINDKGAHIIKVVDRIDGASDFDKNSQEIKVLGEQRKRLMSESFVASLYRNATIKTNESMIKLQQNYPL